jgi:hypothetical protein
MESTYVSKNIFRLPALSLKVTRHEGGLKVQREDRIELTKERMMAEALIKAICAAHDLDTDHFVPHMDIQPPSGPAEEGTIALAYTYDGPLKPGVSDAQLQRFCESELVSRMDEVRTLSRRIAAGEMLSPPHAPGLAGSMSPSDVKDPGRVEDLPLLEATVPSVHRDVGDVAREALSRELVERHAGKFIPIVQIETGGTTATALGGLKIDRPQRKVNQQPAERTFYGYVNVLSLDPAFVEIRAVEHAGDKRNASQKLSSPFASGHERFAELAELLVKGSRARTVFTASDVSEVGAGSKKTKLTLKSWRAADSAEEARFAP